MSPMKHALALTLLLGFALPAAAVDVDDCKGALTHLGTLYQVRSMMMKNYTSSYDVQKFVERRMDELREPLASGGYRWVRWVRPVGEGPVAKEGHTVLAMQDRGDLDSFEATGDHVFAVRVAVPRKRSLMNANNPVWVGTVRVTYSVEGRTRTKEQAVNQWMNPDTSKTIDLGAIADRAEASADVAAAAKDVKQSLVELQFRQAVAEDDPANPAYETIRALDRVRTSADARSIDAEIATLEQTLFPGSSPMPILTLVEDLRQADELMRSSKADDQEKGNRLLKETLRRLR